MITFPIKHKKFGTISVGIFQTKNSFWKIIILSDSINSNSKIHSTSPLLLKLIFYWFVSRWIVKNTYPISKIKSFATLVKD